MKRGPPTRPPIPTLTRGCDAESKGRDGRTKGTGVGDGGDRGSERLRRRHRRRQFCLCPPPPTLPPRRAPDWVRPPVPVGGRVPDPPSLRKTLTGPIPLFPEVVVPGVNLVRGPTVFHPIPEDVPTPHLVPEERGRSLGFQTLDVEGSRPVHSGRRNSSASCTFYWNTVSTCRR